MNSLIFDPRDVDSSVKPADDFFAHVNKKWIQKNPIPPEEARWGSFYVLRVEVEKQLGEILEELNNKEEGSLGDIERKVRNFYRTAMDVETLNRRKDAALQDFLKRIDGITDMHELSRVVGYLHRIGVGAWWGISSDADAKKSDVVALYVGQSGLGLPDRDYYLLDDEKSSAIRSKYVQYAETMMAASPAMLGSNDPSRAPAFSKIVFDIEKNLAAASMTRVELRDIEKQYNKMTPAELSKIAPQIDWQEYFGAIEIPVPEYFIVCQPKFFEAVNHIVETVPLDDIKTYLRWHVLNAFADMMSEDFEKRSFDFYDRMFRGVTEMKSRQRRVLAVLNAVLDEAIGKVYVERHFNEEAKKKVTVLVDHLIAAYRERIKKLEWMGEDTKQKALVKLDAMIKKLGYPDKWKNLSAIKIGTDSYVENYAHAHAFEFDRHMKKVGKPVDRSEWFTAPQVVNAFYNPLVNEIVFPAAILQPPFFDPSADDALNFGGIGTVIGHELTHGFDDEGSKFDARGNLQNWWSEEDRKRFDARTKRLAEQFNRYEALPGLHVNGELTLGENIADLGGMLVAFDGLMLALKDKGIDPAMTIDGLTPAQRFFMNYAVTERGAVREEALRLQVQIDPHSPSEFRVNGPLSNLAEFHDAFGVKPNDALWRDPGDRVEIW